MADFKAEIKNKKSAELYFNKALPDSYRFAMAGTANRVVFEGIKKSNEQFKKEFTLSNNYLVGKTPGAGILKFNKAIPHHDINKISASWGVPEKRGQTDLEFMYDQEKGFQHDGMVPTKNAYPGQNKDRVIKRNLRRKGLQLKSTRGFPRGIAANNRQRTVFFLAKMYKNKFALPGSKQFIYLKPSDEFYGFNEGMYQFAKNTPFGLFPKLKLIYSTTDKKNKRRNPTHWMEKSSNSFRQSEIDDIWEKEFDKSFTRAISRLK